MFNFKHIYRNAFFEMLYTLIFVSIGMQMFYDAWLLQASAQWLDYVFEEIWLILTCENLWKIVYVAEILDLLIFYDGAESCHGTLTAVLTSLRKAQNLAFSSLLHEERGQQALHVPHLGGLIKRNLLGLSLG